MISVTFLHFLFFSSNFYHPQKLPEGNFFTGVCPSFCSEESPCVHYPWCIEAWVPQIQDMRTTPCYWHLVVITWDIFKRVTYPPPPPSVLMSTVRLASGRYASYWNAVLSLHLSFLLKPDRVRFPFEVHYYQDQSRANLNVVYFAHLFNENSSCEIQNNINVQVKKADPIIRWIFEFSFCILFKT